MRARQDSTKSLPASRKSGGKFLRAGSVKRLCQKFEKTRKKINTECTEDGARRSQRGDGQLQAAEEFVEFVGGVEVGFEFAGVEALAEVVEAAGEEVEGG